jgi:membrane associated rhomboid family serine protease
VREAAERRGPLLNRLGFVSAQGTPVVTYALIAANVVAYFVGPVLYGGRLKWINAWAIHPGSSWADWILSGFAHVSFLHIAMNMFVLWQFGTQLEPALGRARFSVLYFLSLLGGSLAVVLFGSAAVGASGAIFGLIAAFAVVLLKLKMPAQGLIASAGIWLVAGFFIGSISWQGHLGGAVTGALVMLVMLRGVEKRQERRNERITPV